MEKIVITSINLDELVNAVADKVVEKLIDNSIINNKEDRLLTRNETAKLLQISLTTLNDWTKKGIIIAQRISSRVRYKESDVFEAMQSTEKYKMRA